MNRRLFNKKTLLWPTGFGLTAAGCGELPVVPQDRKGNQPFCFWYGSKEPHRDYEFG